VPPTTSAPPATRPAEPPGPIDVAAEPIADVDVPVAMAIRPGDDGLYVVRQSGSVVVIRDGVASETPVLDISSDVNFGGEQGFLGLTFTPDGTHAYASYSNSAGDNQLDEFAVAADGTFDMASRRTVFTYDHPDQFGNHNGGNVVFGPDGMLYMSLGDGGGAGDPKRSGQDLNTLLAKIIRIDPSTPSGDKGYSIPPANPFAAGGGLPEIWSYGLRNAWRFSFDRANGDLWIGDVGQGQIEEIDLADASLAYGAGANFGWSAFEGTRRYNDDQPEPDNHVLPVYEYRHEDNNNSITGGFVYRGSAIPNLVGAYVFGDYASGRVWALWWDPASGDDPKVEEITSVPGLASFGEDAGGELYALSVDESRVYKLVPG
jgi:glucose/arabinose dehydrogenase